MVPASIHAFGLPVKSELLDRHWCAVAMKEVGFRFWVARPPSLDRL